MWIIIATACSSFNVSDCFPIVWKPETFITEQLCIERLPYAQANLPDDAISLGCFAVPGLSSI
jgi:hypothetical protein